LLRKPLRPQVRRGRTDVILSNHRVQKTEAASHAFTEWANRLTWKARLPFQVHAGGACGATRFHASILICYTEPKTSWLDIPERHSGRSSAIAMAL
jgi:hypothetical protein